MQQAGISVEIVPGITSGIAAPASIGIPVTHREFTHGVTFVTGHTQNGEKPDWQALVAGGTTLVIYMGMKYLSAIVTDLLEAGMASDLPAAAIQQGTTQQQRQVVSTLAALPAAVKQEGLESPAIIVLGEVVRLARQETLSELIAVAA
jgi:uroporphyrin-III C-methyltransferase